MMINLGKIAVIMVLFLLPCSVYGVHQLERPMQSEDWPTFHHDVLRTGRSYVKSTDLTGGGYLLWAYETGGVIRSSPSISDINGDGRKDIIVGSFDRGVYAISSEHGEPRKLWSFLTEDWVESSPAVADLDGDGFLEVVVGSHDGRVYAVSSVGEEVWSFQTGGVVSSSPAVADLDGDGFLEVVVGSHDGSLYCLSANGTVKWSFKTEGGIFSSPAVGDIDGDGSLEVVVGSDDGRVYAVSSVGEEVWEVSIGSSLRSSPVISHESVFIGAHDSTLYRIDNGKIEWEFKTRGVVSSSPAVADLDGDGFLEVVVGSHDGRVYAVSSVGEEVWSFQTGGVVSSSPAVADLDGDGFLEVVVGSHDGSLYCLSSKGVKKWSFETKGQIRSSPAIGDLDGDGNPEIAVGSDDNFLYVVGIDRDPDQDGFFTSEEKKAGTDPHNPDTDGDGIFDGQDKYPLDFDNDGIPDAEDPFPRIKNVYLYVVGAVFAIFILLSVVAVRKVSKRFKLVERAKQELKLLRRDISNLPEDIKDLREKISKQPERLKVAAVLFLLVASLAFMVVSFQMYLFINYDPRFCLIGCHPATETMQEPYYLWEESVHGKYTTCHDCHHASVTDNMLLVFKTLLHRPIEIEKHAHISDEKCLECHATGVFREKEFNPLISPSVVRLNSSIVPQRSASSIAGHGVHVTREKIHCIECHARAVHRFLPEEEICDKCHYDPRLGPPKKFVEEGEHEEH